MCGLCRVPTCANLNIQRATCAVGMGTHSVDGNGRRGISTYLLSATYVGAASPRKARARLKRPSNPPHHGEELECMETAFKSRGRNAPTQLTQLTQRPPYALLLRPNPGPWACYHPHPIVSSYREAAPGVEGRRHAGKRLCSCRLSGSFRGQWCWQRSQRKGQEQRQRGQVGQGSLLELSEPGWWLSGGPLCGEFQHVSSKATFRNGYWILNLILGDATGSL